MMDPNSHQSPNGQIDSRRVEDISLAFKKLFLAMCRLNVFPWDTYHHTVCRKYPPSVKYRRLFLQELIKKHEATAEEPLDELYDALSEVLGLEEETICYKSYLMLSGDVVSLTESVAVISEGTTGLVTWEAALYLTEWAIENQQVFSRRNVLEFGSGVGLTGIALCRSCKPSKYVFSDCHHGVLKRLRENVHLNSSADGEISGVSVHIEELDWESVPEDKLPSIGVDIVIAADVVYDPSIINCLVSLLSQILKCAGPGSPPEVYIASTIRNPETYNSFKTQLTNAAVQHLVVPGPVTKVFPYNRKSCIELIKLYV
ncbi:protein-lysine N-methyltransferase EEF2KMT isoform X2 [Denticeps clupeoides]|uniref:protein-lysine N-methyltransferase EEF2KMT isoform X2 n=1 Tax=Denticeps clupeoides TaxID=299321 RepID=UPI0010A59D6D|nr:protein-lysine N-methyltransferase EEF2KMT isoform X2 [Denticeps clupeoides]